MLASASSFEHLLPVQLFATFGTIDKVFFVVKGAGGEQGYIFRITLPAFFETFGTKSRFVEAQICFLYFNAVNHGVGEL
ncbi:hypothetical protein D3C71_2085450 [compost metagenome]